jgi:hypothetical protein
MRAIAFRRFWHTPRKRLTNCAFLRCSAAPAVSIPSRKSVILPARSFPCAGGVWSPPRGWFYLVLVLVLVLKPIGPDSLRGGLRGFG